MALKVVMRWDFTACSIFLNFSQSYEPSTTTNTHTHMDVYSQPSLSACEEVVIGEFFLFLVHVSYEVINFLSWGF